MIIICSICSHLLKLDVPQSPSFHFKLGENGCVSLFPRQHHGSLLRQQGHGLRVRVVGVICTKPQWPGTGTLQQILNEFGKIVSELQIFKILEPSLA